jgi:hypothetical protein
MDALAVGAMATGGATHAVISKAVASRQEATMAARGEREGICDLEKRMGIDAATEPTGRNRHCPARRSQNYAGTYLRRDFLPLSSYLSGGRQVSRCSGKALASVIELRRPMAIRHLAACA